MDKALTFFRVFDLAFFAPGTILLVVGWYLWAPESVRPTQPSAVENLITFLAFIAAAFFIGLVIHAVVWTVFKPILVNERSGSPDEDQNGAESAGWIPFPNHFDGNTRIDLILYFWYLRATCWNGAFALGISALLVLCSSKLDPLWVRCATSLALIFSGVMLCLLGSNYHRTLRNSLSPSNPAIENGSE